jgi:hypothetical protein
MSIGKQQFGWLCAALLVLLTTCVSAESYNKQSDKPSVAWWYDLKLTPNTTVVGGIRVTTFDKNWEKAAVLSKAAFAERLPAADYQSLLKSPFVFELSANLDGDKLREKFFVGVYKTKQENEGRFVAITKNGKLVQYFTEEGVPGFSALLLTHNTLRWYKCMECGEFETIRWDGRAYILE